jgi:hypothetical protein
MGYQAPIDEASVGSSSWDYGFVSLSRNYNVSDYTDPKFFLLDVSITSDDNDIAWMEPPHTIDDWTNQWGSGGGGYWLPNVSIAVDAVGIAFYSLLLSDFGVGNQSTNALASQDGIQFLQTINDTDSYQDSRWNIDNSQLWVSGTIGEVYNSSTDPSCPFEDTTPTTLYTQYLCSVPKRKGELALFFAVLLADLVFLKACWALFGWIATWWLGRNDLLMNYCDGCVEALRRDDVALSNQGPAKSMGTTTSSIASRENFSKTARLLDDPLLTRDTAQLIQ